MTQESNPVLSEWFTTIKLLTFITISMGSIKSKCGKNAAAVEDVNEEGGGIDTVSEATEVGGARNMGVNTNGELKKVMAEGRKEIKDAHEKLNSSLTTPVLSDHNGAEARVRYIKII